MTDKEKLKLYESDGIVGSYYALNRRRRKRQGSKEAVD